MGLITQKEWAKRNGFSPPYVSKLVKKGKIPLVNGLIDEEKVDDIMLCLEDPGQPAQRKYGGVNIKSDDLHRQLLKIKIKNETVKGEMLETRAKTEIAELIPAEEVRKTAFAMGRIIRDGILNVPDRVSALLATIDDASKIHEILTKELRDALQDLSRDDE